MHWRVSIKKSQRTEQPKGGPPVGRGAERASTSHLAGPLSWLDAVIHIIFSPVAQGLESFRGR